MAFRIPLAAPDVGPDELAAVRRVLESGRLSLGPEALAFEAALAEFCGSGGALAISSGTAGLTLCLQTLGIGSGDEVITVSYTAMSTANAIVSTGARPVFADIDPETLNIDPLSARERVSPRTRAMVVVHLFGRPAAMESLGELAATHGLEIIEDACEALGSYYGRRHVGTLGRAGVFGFYPNKVITCGEGGAIITDDGEFLERCRTLSNQGRIGMSDDYSSERAGFNYRLSELGAALGAAQMRRLPELLQRREELAAAYCERLSGLDAIELPELKPEEGQPSWFAFNIRLTDQYTSTVRDQIIQRLGKVGIQCGRYFPPVHLSAWFRRTQGTGPGDLPVTESVAARSIAIPFHTHLSDDNLDEVAYQLGKALDDLENHRSGGKREAGSGKNR